MRAIIVGAGIGGLAAGIALARRGIAPVVLEQASEMGEVGAGLQLSPNAMKVLRALGLGSAVEAVSSRPETLELRLGKSGQRIFSIPMGEAGERRYGAPYLHVHRADLQGVLLAALREIAPNALRLGVRVEGLEADGVRLAGGEVVRGDVIVAADGVRSGMRAAMGHADSPRFTGCMAWRMVVPAGAVKGALPNGAVVWAGAGRHAVTYRVRGGKLINFVGVAEVEGWSQESWSKRGDLAEVRRLFADFAAPVRAVIDAASETWLWALFDRDPLPVWRKGRATLLGDAAHAMPPFQAQGAAMAIEDAYVLARELAAGSDVDAGLDRYEALRRPRTAKMLGSARANRTRFHHGDFVGQLVNYGPMRLADLFAPRVIRSAQDWIYAFDATAPALD